MGDAVDAIGQAYIGRYDASSADLDSSPLLHHRLVHRQLPTILDSRSLAWVHVKHAWQDTRVGVDPEQARAVMLPGHRKLSSYDGDWDTVLSAFPHLRADIRRAQRRHSQVR